MIINSSLLGLRHLRMLGWMRQMVSEVATAASDDLSAQKGRQALWKVVEVCRDR